MRVASSITLGNLWSPAQDCQVDIRDMKTPNMYRSRTARKSTDKFMFCTSDCRIITRSTRGATKIEERYISGIISNLVYGISI